MKLAIVIPYYKIDYFEETIKSVAQQTDRNFMLYIGNDKSPDNPLPVIEISSKRPISIFWIRRKLWWKRFSTSMGTYFR